MADADMVPLLRVCALLNPQNAKYLVIGGRVYILHGAVRTTQDLDILIEATGENAQKVLIALAQMEDGAAAELTPRDLLDNVVVKIADEVEVDVCTHTWKLPTRTPLAPRWKWWWMECGVPTSDSTASSPARRPIASRIGWTFCACARWKNFLEPFQFLSWRTPSAKGSVLI